MLSETSADPATSTSGTSGTSDTSDATSTVGTTGDPSTIDDTGTSDASTTGEMDIELVDPCLEYGEEDCPEVECMMVRARAQDEGECNTDFSATIDLCIGKGGVTSSSLKTTYYAAVDGQVYYLVLGHNCAIDWLSFEPYTWFECTGAAEEPELCSCLCGTNGCPFEEETNLLDSCTPPPVCGPVVPHAMGSSPSEYDLCTLAALRDRTPGVVQTEVYGFVGFHHRAYLDGSAETQHVSSYENDVCWGPLNGTWDPAEHCTLKPPSYFEECLASGDSGLEECLSGFNWFEDCTPMPAACP